MDVGTPLFRYLKKLPRTKDQGPRTKDPNDLTKQIRLTNRRSRQTILRKPAFESKQLKDDPCELPAVETSYNTII